MVSQRSQRSALPKDEARQRYVDIGELVVLQQIKSDSEALDTRPFAVGPFARLDAGAVAAHDGKTRGVITNLFGSQAAFQAETMALALSVGDAIAEIQYPEPGRYATAEDWLDALLDHESSRGPQRGAAPTVSYAFLWALWLTAVPYGLWSEQIAEPSMAEHIQWVRRLEQLFTDALEHFDVTLQDGTTVTDLAASLASLVEGVWLNQCLTTCDPCDPSRPIAAALRRSGRLLWRGATRPQSGPVDGGAPA